ncbi:hypothetical protein [Agrococcus sp. DT81.2]|uniref:hypothetical protein n=1 Tax=Agrococcus sp. DT81.2 TaxID=3393414 RepID=UPI003CE4EAA6
MTRLQTPARTGWDGPDDTWRESDIGFELFLKSFDQDDKQRLLAETRVYKESSETPARRLTAKTIQDALLHPTPRRIKTLRAYTDRELADALASINHYEENHA